LKFILKRLQNEWAYKTSGSDGDFTGGNGGIAWIVKEKPGYD